MKTVWCFIVVLVLAYTCAVASAANGKCVAVNRGFKNGTDNPLVLNSEPFILPPEGQQLLRSICDNIDASAPVCCNTTQVAQLRSNFILIDATLYHCRACDINFKRMWCSFTCGTQQADYVTVKEMFPAPWQEYVKTLTFTVSKEFQDNFWDNCKDDLMGSAIIKKLYPNVRNFLNDLQTMKRSNPVVEFNFLDKPESGGFTTSLIPCEQMCYCAYCTKACNQKPPLNPDLSCKIGPNISCWAFAGIAGGILGAAVLAAVMAALVQRVANWYRRRDSADSNNGTEGNNGSGNNGANHIHYHEQEHRSLLYQS